MESHMECLDLQLRSNHQAKCKIRFDAETMSRISDVLTELTTRKSTVHYLTFPDILWALDLMSRLFLVKTTITKGTFTQNSTLSLAAAPIPARTTNLVLTFTDGMNFRIPFFHAILGDMKNRDMIPGMNLPQSHNLEVSKNKSRANSVVT